MVNKGKKRIAKLEKNSTLLLTKGKGEDEDIEDEEKLEEEEPLKKKGKVIITIPAKPSTTVFTRRSSKKKSNKEGGDIIFRKPPPTFQEKLKDLESCSSITNFKALKYETRTKEEKMKIEDLVVEKKG